MDRPGLATRRRPGAQPGHQTVTKAAGCRRIARQHCGGHSVMRQQIAPGNRACALGQRKDPQRPVAGMGGNAAHAVHAQQLAIVDMRRLGHHLRHGLRRCGTPLASDPADAGPAQGQ